LASTMKGVLKRRGDRGATCGGVLSLRLEWQIDEEKKRQRKYVVALDGRLRIKITQQPTKSTRRDEGGEGGELQPARGAQWKRKLIVWGRSSWVVYQIDIKLKCLLKKFVSPPDHRVNKKPHNPPSDNLLERGALADYKFRQPPEYYVETCTCFYVFSGLRWLTRWVGYWTPTKPHHNSSTYHCLTPPPWHHYL
jgi:hypothetical protein